MKEAGPHDRQIGRRSTDYPHASLRERRRDGYARTYVGTSQRERGGKLI